MAIPDEDWLRSRNITFMAAVRTTRAVLPGMLEAGRGTIVTVSSVNAFLPDPLVIDYCAAKAALTNFCKALSKEVGPKGIRVNTVSPGPVATALWLGAGGVAEHSGRRDTAGTGRGGGPGGSPNEPPDASPRPDEVAELVALLAGERAGNVAGSDFTIDGGLIKTL